MKKYLIGTALITVSGLVSLPAHAQLTDEIIVTATKKSTNLQDTAVSVTAYTGEALQQLGLENSVSLAAQTPGLNCLLYTSPSPRDLSTSRMPSSA